MSRFCSLASSSKGNSTYLAGGNTSLLVDAGITCKRMADSLRGLEVNPAELEGILITHEHTDHIRGLAIFLKNYDIPVYAPVETLQYLAERDLVPDHATLVAIESESPFSLGDIQVTAFDTPHDAVHSVGYRLEMPDGRRVGFATDLGHVTETVKRHLAGCDFVMLESNFDPGMLSCSRYPYVIKRRIQGMDGHLSNEDCAGQIVELVQAGTTRFVLGHLSENNNLPELAFQTTKNVLDSLQMEAQKDYLLSVAPASNPHSMVVF